MFWAFILDISVCSVLAMDYLSGIAYNYGVTRNIEVDIGVRSDKDIITDSNATNDDGVHSYPY